MLSATLESDTCIQLKKPKNGNYAKKILILQGLEPSQNKIIAIRLVAFMYGSSDRQKEKLRPAVKSKNDPQRSLEFVGSGVNRWRLDDLLLMVCCNNVFISRQFLDVNTRT